MLCERCRRADACWHDHYRDEALCRACCPDRSTAYGMQFIAPLRHDDAVRLSRDRDRDESGR